MSVTISKVTPESYPTPTADQPILFIGHPSPRLTWRFQGDAQDWVQQSYTIKIQRVEGQEEKEEVYQEQTEESVFVSWPSSPLQPRESVTISVQATSTTGLSTPWSTPLTIERTLSPSDWSAQVITSNIPPTPSSKSIQPIHIRKTFSVQNKPTKARIYITALGIYTLTINGRSVSPDEVLSPGWQSYNHRQHFQSYDIASFLVVGENVIGAILSEGWFAGRLGFLGGRSRIYGEEMGLIAQMEIDGEMIVTSAEEGDGWMWTEGPLISSEIYDGEVYDSRKVEEMVGWDTVEGVKEKRGGKWNKVKEGSAVKGELICPMVPPVSRAPLTRYWNCRLVKQNP